MEDYFAVAETPEDHIRLEADIDSELAALAGNPRASLYRRLLSSYPAGVCVVTAFDEYGGPRGLTLIAFCGVSLDPPLVLVCVDRASNTLPAIQATGGFTVNFLGSGSPHVARLMSTKAEDKFESIAWVSPSQPEGGPILHEDSAGYIVCRTWHSVEAGDHWVFVGEVLDGAVEEDRLPLVFHRRRYRELG